MSRSYYKTAKCPFCVVNHKADSKFRKTERRKRSQYYRTRLKKQLLNNSAYIDDIVDLLYSSLYNKGFKDFWTAPSDGHVRIYKTGKANYIIECNGIYNKENKEYWYNKYKRK